MKSGQGVLVGVANLAHYEGKNMKPYQQVETMADPDQNISSPLSSIITPKSLNDSYSQAVANLCKPFG